MQRNKRKGLDFHIVKKTGGACIADFMSWRISQGIFFTQAKYYEQELTVVASFRDVFGMEIQSPIILFLGLLSTIQYKKIASISRVLFMVYGIGIFLILVLSSQTRPAVTALIFIFIMLKMDRKTAIKWRHIISIGLIGLAGIFFIQGVRAQSERFALADNQLIYAVYHSGFDAISGLASLDTRIEIIVNRIGDGLVFLSAIIDTIKDKPVLFGQGIVSSLYSVVPRFIWPDKPAVVPYDTIVENLLGLWERDVPLGPITQFYIEGGWVGVIAGYFLFGWMMGIFTVRVMNSNKVGMWIILFLLWNYISNLEYELIIGMLVVFRDAVIVYLLYRTLLFFIWEFRVLKKSVNLSKQNL
ncbi:MAG: hypothetical protein HY753_08115 [Nitrospirae bacterium]|nr:hypothetical protein [Nitrospirota bacterium]